MSKIWHSIQGKLLIVFLLTLLPVYVIGMLIYSWGLSATRQSVEERSLSQLEVYTSSFENDIQRLVTLQIDLLNSIEVAWLANMNSVMSDYERGKAINDLQKRLTYLSAASSYAIDATACIPSLDMVVESTGGARAFTVQDDALMQIQAPKSGLPIVIQDDLVYTSTAFRLRGDQAIYNIAVQLSQKQILEELHQINSTDGIALAIFGDSLMMDTGLPGGWDEVETTGTLLEKIDGQAVGSGLLDVRLNGTHYLMLFSRCDKLEFTVCNLIDRNVLYEPANRFIMLLWIFVVVGLAVLLLFAIFVRSSIHRPMQLLMDAFRQMEKNDLNATIDYPRNDEYGYLFEQFNHMLGTLSELIEQSYEQTIMLRNAELKQLQAQINPHFLYNSYFLLHRMIQRQDNERAALFSSYLGKYMKYITRNAASQISLRQEVGHARTYTDIQALRFEGRIHVEFGELPEGFSERTVPRLILQPLMENAFEHGLRNKRAGGLLTVRFAREEKNTLHVLVEDNGEELTDADMETLSEVRGQQRMGNMEYTAVLNIHHRLCLALSEGSGLRFFRSELGGLGVCLTLCFKEGSDDKPTDRG
ncbi:MAG: sensor histidine kinase [Oscillospiraceae bacterium]